MLKQEFWTRLSELQGRLPGRTQPSREALITNTVEADKARRDPWKSISQIAGDPEFYSAMNANLELSQSWQSLKNYLEQLSREILGNRADSEWIRTQIQAIQAEVDREANIDLGTKENQFESGSSRTPGVAPAKGIKGEQDLQKHHSTFDEICENETLPELLSKSKMFDEYSSRITILAQIGMNAGNFVYPNEMPTPFIHRLLQALKDRKLLIQTRNLLKKLPDYDVRPENFPELGRLLKDIDSLLNERRVGRSRSSFPATDD